MARQKKTYFPGYTYHLVQRGNNLEAVFFEPSDYAHYLDTLSDLLARCGVALHANVLMTSHILFLLKMRGL